MRDFSAKIRQNDVLTVSTHLVVLARLLALGCWVNNRKMLAAFVARAHSNDR
jgi:hypothetical protein